MIRGTTPTFILKIKDSDIDLGLADNIIFSLEQGARSIEITGEDIEIDGNTAMVYLSQEDSISFRPGLAEVQLNWTYLDARGKVCRAATRPKQIEIEKQLYRKVIE